MANGAGKTIGYISAAIFILFGVLFILASYTGTGRLLVGLVLLGIGFGIIVIIKMNQPKPDQKVIIEQKIDLSGTVKTEEMKCQRCGGLLDKNSVSIKEGAVFINCPYCKTAYQITEQPKW